MQNKRETLLFNGCDNTNELHFLCPRALKMLCLFRELNSKLQKIFLGSIEVVFTSKCGRC